MLYTKEKVENFFSTVYSLRWVLTTPIYKSLGFWLSSVACNRASFSDSGVTGINLFESELLLPSSPMTTLTVNFCLMARTYSQSPMYQVFKLF